MTKKRRRGIQSDWVLALRQSRTAKALRRHLPSAALIATSIRADTTGCPQTTASPLAENQNIAPNSTGVRNEDRRNSSGSVLSPLQNPGLDISSDEANDDPREAQEVHVEGANQFQPIQDTEWQQPPDEQDQSATVPAPIGTLESSQASAGQLRQESAPCPSCQSRQEDDFGSRTASLETLQEMRRKWDNRLTLTAILAVVGSVRYTVEHYDFTRNILLEEMPGSGQNWPPYSRTQQYFRQILERCLPESHLVPLPKKSTSIMNAAQYVQQDPDLDQQPNNSTGTNEQQETEYVRIFLPSAWAKLDVATSTVFEKMFPSTSENGDGTEGLEHSRLVRDRESVTNACDHIFIKNRGQCVPCGPGSIIEVSVQRRRPRLQTPYSFSHGNNVYGFTASTVGTWCVAARGRSNPSAERVMTIPSLSAYRKTVVKSLSTAPPRPDHTELTHLGVLPGDICTLLSAERCSRDNEFDAVIVHRFWRFQDGTPSILILWVRVPTRNNETTLRTNITTEIGGCHVVESLSLSRPASTTPTHGSARNANRGHLADGRPFVVYRILLYCDDFQKSSQHYPKGSAGGCYFLPLSLPPEERRSTSCVRIVSLTPPGVSTNEVLHYIVDDLVHATVCGLDGCTPTGDRLKIFVDIVGFVGDYPAAAGTVDVIGHTGRAPCTLCTFRRPQASEAQGSRYGYTTKVHAGNSTFLRHAERHLSLRRSNISDEDARILGMVNSGRTAERNCPLVHLYNVLESRRSRIPQTTFGKPVVPGYFDPYRCNVIAPDHLLTGLSQDILNTVFEFLPTDLMRVHADVYICAALRENGLLPQRQVFNFKKKTLHSMTLSELYGVILVAAPIFRIVTSSCPSGHVVRDVVSLLIKLQRLIALTYWWPQREIDGEEAENFVHRRRDNYFSELKTLSKSYVEAVNTFCSKADMRKIHLDKPNLHRLIELYEHTIPAFGHVREFMELVFEGAHQPLKRCIANSNNHNAHIFAAEHCVGNDWLGRVASLSRDLTHGNPSRSLGARRGLRRLLLDAGADMLDETRNKDFIVETDEIIRNLFTRALRIHFGKDNRISNFAIPKQTAWEGRGRVTLGTLSRSTGLSRDVLRVLLRTAITWLNAVYPPVSADSQEETQHSIKACRYAKRVKVSDTGHQIGKPSGFDMLSSNCVVQAHATYERAADKILKSIQGPYSTAVFFVIVAVLHRKGDMVWALCARCSVTEDIIQVTRGVDDRSFQILCLTPEIRRVAVYHICQEEGRSNDCDIDMNKKVISHSHLPLQGSRMYFQTRQDGYPPRQA